MSFSPRSVAGCFSPWSPRERYEKKYREGGGLGIPPTRPRLASPLVLCALCCVPCGGYFPHSTPKHRGRGAVPCFCSCVCVFGHLREQGTKRGAGVYSLCLCVSWSFAVSYGLLSLSFLGLGFFGCFICLPVSFCYGFAWVSMGYIYFIALGVFGVSCPFFLFMGLRFVSFVSLCLSVVCFVGLFCGLSLRST